MYKDFNKVNGVYDDNPDFSGLGGKLIVENGEYWDAAIGMPERLFYDLWSADLPGNVRILVALQDGGCGEITIHSADHNRQYFRAERYFDRPNGTMQLREVRIEAETLRRKGIGTVLLENQINAARHWGIHKFTLKAGRENGPFFWARRGARIDLSAAGAQDRFIRDIRKGLYELEGSLSATFTRAVYDLLDVGGDDINCRIARLPSPSGEENTALFDFVTDYPACFDLDDKVQMQNVYAAMGNTGRLRAVLKAGFPAQNLQNQ